MGKSENYFSETVAVCDLKVGRCIELKNIMKLHEYQRSRSFFDLYKRSLSFQT